MVADLRASLRWQTADPDVLVAGRWGLENRFAVLAGAGAGLTRRNAAQGRAAFVVVAVDKRPSVNDPFSDSEGI